ncbi:phosphate ABC transporter permease subunit PstC [Jannaschia rubra]|uniref:Phosphate transport system permease protein n=1 Tax=Jannaschia rubra TaxID=282197 RepID=A0A0M6XTN0_9RHOB|nr:phosphate ABC transporter permease subunit PstC [Jannaschia rubra]CTQ34098.1 Phosphate transport system permease protein PstC [Jannaschia rubra]SFG23249.1 phosphate ABC transporter membrane protein 1, PhoT family [Jannaschia rubra]
MPLTWVLPILIVMGLVAYGLSRRRAIASVAGDARRLHSLPGHYGLNALLATMVPALIVLALWTVAQPLMIERMVAADFPRDAVAPGSTLALTLSDVQRVAEGLEDAARAGVIDAGRIAAMNLKEATEALRAGGTVMAAPLTEAVLTAAVEYHARTVAMRRAMLATLLAVAAIGAVWALHRSRGEFRARNAVEQAVRLLLIAAASVAILTTLGIVLSMLFEAMRFFDQYPWQEFFFSTTWSPSFSGRGGASQLGILPLLWGTLYISFIALVVAVPIGLFAAIYLSEYAGKRFRTVAKPLIEILAGIPTIVYGLFALVTVGPLLRDAFAEPLGLGNSASSVMTAGLVMGIMLIPFVSSLSDDIISAVPQAMRDGSLGLGATKSETIRQVIVPAALPGIVGAILLAASRAIGETMIVVLGAGAAARLDLNPFEAMTTVTVKIVSQLTGDTDFASPETLVAFALGLTLFVITLCLNVLALFIVRRYREQYE